MIARLSGKATRLSPGKAVIDVGGVGYEVSVPLDVWEGLKENIDIHLWICTYVREDRLELFGFGDLPTRTLFEELIKRPGIGPRTALELCSVPRDVLLRSVAEQDARFLQTVKGIGKKTAEKLLIDLQSLTEKHPDMLAGSRGSASGRATGDQDAIDALMALGYDTSTVLRTLKNLPKELETTEERVAAALRSL